MFMMSLTQHNEQAHLFNKNNFLNMKKTEERNKSITIFINFFYIHESNMLERSPK